jgi:hypothetical protein
VRIGIQPASRRKPRFGLDRVEIRNLRRQINCDRLAGRTFQRRQINRPWLRGEAEARPLGGAGRKPALCYAARLRTKHGRRSWGADQWQAVMPNGTILANGRTWAFLTEHLGLGERHDEADSRPRISASCAAGRALVSPPRQERARSRPPGLRPNVAIPHTNKGSKTMGSSTLPPRTALTFFTRIGARVSRSCSTTAGR